MPGPSSATLSPVTAFTRPSVLTLDWQPPLRKSIVMLSPSWAT